MGLFDKIKKAPKTDKVQAAAAQAADKSMVDVTELQAAIAALNGRKPSSGKAAVPATVLSPISAQIKKEEREANPEIGDRMQDGSVYAGLTEDGTQKIFAMPKDLGVTLTFVDAARAVKKLNADEALGHDDWQIGSLDMMRVLQKNQNTSGLKGSFKTAASCGSGYPDRYWSSTREHYSASIKGSVCFSDGGVTWNLEGFYRHSCRPVRLVPVKPLS